MVNAAFTISVQSILIRKVYAAVAMGPARTSTLLAAGLLSIATAVPVSAAPVAPPTPATGHTRIVEPITVRLLNDLNFGNLTVANAGTAVVDPFDTITTTGGVTSIGGNPYSALFEVIAPVAADVHIKVPKGNINVLRIGGLETMKVDKWTLSNKKKIRDVGAGELFTFSIGATLHVNANQAEGLYVGTFLVEFDYH